jgi:hypothetical protein
VCKWKGYFGGFITFSVVTALLVRRLMFTRKRLTNSAQTNDRPGLKRGKANMTTPRLRAALPCRYLIDPNTTAISHHTLRYRISLTEAFTTI